MRKILRLLFACSICTLALLAADQASSSCYAYWPCSYPPPSSVYCSCPGAGTCTSGFQSYGFVNCDCVGDPDAYLTCSPPICGVHDCGCDGKPCTTSSECGTCMGFGCACSGPKGHQHCLCP